MLSKITIVDLNGVKSQGSSGQSWSWIQILLSLWNENGIGDCVFANSGSLNLRRGYCPNFGCFPHLPAFFFFKKKKNRRRSTV